MGKFFAFGVSRRLLAYVAVGIAFGLLYVMADTLLDAVLARGRGQTARVVEAFHQVIDRVIPLAAGALAGIAVHFARMRASMARAEARRADDLLDRLQKIERDQAVWVVAAATLHDVKNPLHAMGLLIDEILEIDDTAARNALLAKVRGQMDRANASLASLRSLARDARPEFTSVTLDEVVAELAGDIVPIALRDGIEVRVQAGRVRAKGDRTFVRIILENLIANSIDGLRARGGSGRLDIEVVRVGEEAVVRVHDDGPGIDGQDDAAAFEPLASTKPRGLGLGLSIARALARAMHGDVACAPAAGWSTTFELRLPSEPT